MHDESQRNGTPPSWLVTAAFAAVYVVWGSTYLAIRYGVETIPPFVLAGGRALTAGTVLYVFARLRGGVRPTPGQWRDACITGALMLMIGNGGVTWAERVIPSGVTALVVALVPLWMVLLDWARPNGVRPRKQVLVGVALGFAGVALLARNHAHDVTGSRYAWGLAALLAASIGWAMGSIFSRHARKPGSPLLAISMQMIMGGALLFVLGGLSGELSQFSWHRLSTRSAEAWLYLTAFGSLIGFTAYAWLIQVSTPAKVSTYAYVNPFIAVLLGCTVGHETVSGELFAAGATIVVAVALIVSSARTASSADAPSNEVRAKASPVSESR